MCYVSKNRFQGPLVPRVWPRHLTTKMDMNSDDSARVVVTGVGAHINGEYNILLLPLDLAFITDMCFYSVLQESFIEVRVESLYGSSCSKCVTDVSCVGIGIGVWTNVINLP